VAVYVHFIVSGVRPIVVGLLASCIGVDCRPCVFALQLCASLYCPARVGLYHGSPQTLFFLNAKHARHVLEFFFD
jgi:hypothetical protein